MRWLLLVLALAGPAAGQAPEEDPFAPVPEDAFGDGALLGARARFTESLALAKRDLAASPGAAAFERAAAVLEPLDRHQLLVPRVRRALGAPKLDDDERLGLQALLGYLLVESASGTFGGVQIRIVNGNIQIVRGDDAERKKRLQEAIPLLSAALRLKPRGARTREALANALEQLARLEERDPPQKAAELRAEAVALRGKRGERALTRLASGQAPKLRDEAEQMERWPTPDHATALELRKRALVLDFCAHTIPFEYEPVLFTPVALLAPEELVRTNLTRSYRKASGDIDHVPPQYYPAPEAKRREIVRGLAEDATDGAAAALLAVVRHAATEDPVAREAVDSLVAANHAATRANLPRMLEDELFAEDALPFGLPRAPVFYSAFTLPAGQRLFVQLAARLELREAAPVLRAALPLDEDLVYPRGIARALGRVGGPEDAEALLAIARDPLRDVYFRRQAVDGLSLLAPERLADLPDEPLLALAVTAARYRSAPDDAGKGALLAALESEHEADEAAAYCAELGIDDAIPVLERLIEQKHYAAEALRTALGRLR